MPCWVAPIIAAEIWGLPNDCITACIRDGTIVSKNEGGFVFLDVTSRTSQTAAMARQRSMLGWPATFMPIVTPSEAAALLSTPLLPDHTTTAQAEVFLPAGAETVSEAATGFAASVGSFTISSSPADPSLLTTNVRQVALYSGAGPFQARARSGYRRRRRTAGSQAPGSNETLPRNDLSPATSISSDFTASSEFGSSPEWTTSSRLTAPSGLMAPPEPMPASVHDEDELPLSAEAEENDRGPDIRQWRTARQAASRLRKPPPRRMAD